MTKVAAVVVTERREEREDALGGVRKRRDVYDATCQLERTELQRHAGSSAVLDGLSP